MRRKMVAGNWKMNKDFAEAEQLVEDILELFPNKIDNVEVVLSPPYPFLELVGDIVMERQDFALAAQNCSSFESGAYTGEVAAEMLASVGCEYVIIGHSERRQIFKEDNTTLFQKVERALDADLCPIYCIGETLEERNGGKLESVLKAQMEHLFSLEPEDFRSIVFAYEPVWAIGTGVTASPQQAEDAHAFVRALIAERMGEEVANDAIILYGGSVKPSNAAQLFGQPNIDGGLIGGASLDAKDFVEIIKSA